MQRNDDDDDDDDDDDGGSVVVLSKLSHKNSLVAILFEHLIKKQCSRKKKRLKLFPRFGDIPGASRFCLLFCDHGDSFFKRDRKKTCGLELGPVRPVVFFGRFQK